MSIATRVSTLSLSAALIGSAALALTGCEFDTIDLLGPMPTAEAQCFVEDLQTGEGDLAGTYADVTIPEGTETAVQGWSPGFMHSHVELLVESDGGASAAMVDIYGDLNAADFLPGSRRVYRLDDAASTEFMMVMGCFGPSRGEWTDEGLADQVVISVEGRGSERTIHFKATFDGTDGEATGTLTGSFDVSTTPTDMTTECPEGWD